METVSALGLAPVTCRWYTVRLFLLLLRRFCGLCMPSNKICLHKKAKILRQKGVWKVGLRSGFFDAKSELLLKPFFCLLGMVKARPSDLRLDLALVASPPLCQVVVVPWHPPFFGRRTEIFALKMNGNVSNFKNFSTAAPIPFLIKYKGLLF